MMGDQTERPARTDAERERAQTLLLRLGFTDQAREAIARFPMCTSISAALEKSEEVLGAVPHWTEGMPPDAPEMLALRQARIDAGMIQAPHNQERDE